MRFRLRTDSLSFINNQVKGGIWYKPPWWDAVSRVPPVHFQPRVRKAVVPNITYMEDSLLK